VRSHAGDGDLTEKIGTISKYQQFSPKEVQSEQREEREIWGTLGGFRVQEEDLLWTTGKSLGGIKAEGQEDTRKTRG
jgi:hypothetical protein